MESKDCGERRGSDRSGFMAIYQGDLDCFLRSELLYWFYKWGAEIMGRNSRKCCWEW